jgi:hypothetical protein
VVQCYEKKSVGAKKATLQKSHFLKRGKNNGKKSQKNNQKIDFHNFKM